MRSGIENWLLNHWYGAGRPPWYLRMLVPIYRAAYQRSQRRGSSSTYRANAPLIVVGNVTAGGTGKTPLVIRLCEIVREMGMRPGVASTGYGRRSRETLIVESDGDPGIYGDEPVLLSARSGVPVVVATRRSQAVARLNEMGLDLIISDDGLQQADLQRDVEICVVDGQRGIGNGYLIPAGPLREDPRRLRQVDHVVTNGQWAGKPDGLDASLMEMKPGMVLPVGGGEGLTVDQFQQKHAGIVLHAIAGIGNPGRFFGMLKTMGFDIEPHSFPDHHEYAEKDFDSLTSDSTIIMTEKDAVKCSKLGLGNAWYLPVDAQLPGEFEDAIREKIVKLLKRRPRK